MSFIVSDLVTSIRADLGIETPQDGSSGEALDDTVIIEKIQDFVRIDLSRFFPKFEIRTLTVTMTGSTVDQAYTLGNDVRDVVGMHRPSLYDNINSGVIDPIFGPLNHSSVPGELSLPSMWMITMREISQLRRLTRMQYAYDFFTKKLYLKFTPSTGDLIYYIPRITLGVDDTSMAMLPDDLRGLVENGAKVEVMRALARIRSGLPGFQGSTTTLDHTAGPSFSSLTDKLEKKVTLDLRALEVRTKGMHLPMHIGL